MKVNNGMATYFIPVYFSFQNEKKCESESWVNSGERQKLWHSSKAHSVYEKVSISIY